MFTHWASHYREGERRQWEGEKVPTSVASTPDTMVPLDTWELLISWVLSSALHLTICSIVSAVGEPLLHVASCLLELFFQRGCVRADQYASRGTNRTHVSASHRSCPPSCGGEGGEDLSGSAVCESKTAQCDGLLHPYLSLVRAVEGVPAPAPHSV